MVEIDAIIKSAKSYNPALNAAKVQEAYLLAKKAHHDQLRKSGEPYISHPLSVALILTTYEADEDTIIAAILHDVLEDTDYSFWTLKKKFGKDISFLVDGVTKLTRKLHRKIDIDEKIETLRKVFSSLGRDPRILLIKLADRLHNLETIQFLPIEKQMRIAHETLNFYVPLAKNVQLWQLKEKLENKCFEIISPALHEEFANLLKVLAAKNRQVFTNIQRNLTTLLAQAGIQAEIIIDLFSPHALYQLKSKGMNIETNFFQVLVCPETKKECYAALGLIHNYCKPIARNFQDFIALPKKNRYQALHTTVIDKSGQVLKIVIQTKQMRAAACKAFKYPGCADNREANEAIDELKDSISVLDSRHEEASAFINALREEIFCDYVHFFDDIGNDYRLPQEATVLDFFFYYQSRSNKRRQARVSVPLVAMINGERHELKTVIQNDDVIKFFKGKANTDQLLQFLRYAKTFFAQQELLELLKRVPAPAARQAGENLLRQELTRFGFTVMLEHLEVEMSAALLPKIIEAGKEHFLEILGRGAVDLGEIMYSCYQYVSREKYHRPAGNPYQDVLIQIYNPDNRVGFVKDILDLFRRLHISIKEIRGYSPERSGLGVLDITIHTKLSSEAFTKMLIPLCNKLEQIDGVSMVQMDFFQLPEMR